MRRLVFGLALAGVSGACDAPCEPDQYPAVIIHVPARACEPLVVLLSQPDQPSIRCEPLQTHDGCEAWCGRARLSGPARVRVQTQGGAVIADLAVDLSDARCPTGPDLRIVSGPTP